jgi:AcrR family transcriptional regulator
MLTTILPKAPGDFPLFTRDRVGVAVGGIPARALRSVNQLIDKNGSTAYAIGQVIDEREGGQLAEELETGQGGGNRRALVVAAYARIAVGGFEGLRTRDVASDVGINIGTLHYYFPHKEDLIRAVVRHTTAKFAATLSGGGTPAEQLRRHLEGIRYLLKTDEELWKALSEVSLRAARDEAIAEVVQQGEEQWFAFLSGLVAQGVEQRCLGHHLQPDNVAAVLVATIRGVSMPTMSARRSERIDLVFDQLEQWLGLSQAAAFEPHPGDAASLG